MPEIIEVEKLRRQLSPAWWTRKIIKFWWETEASVDPRKFVQGDWDTFVSGVMNEPIYRVWRVGKILWVALGLERDRPIKGWKIHMSSTGWLMPGNEKAALVAQVDPIYQNFLHSVSEKNIRIKIELNDGQIWNYHDSRTWSKWELCEVTSPREDSQIKAFGPDWIEEMDDAADALIMTTTRRRLKDVLTDQRLAAGLGNYLACEVAWRARIHPHRRFDTITPSDRKKLACTVIATLALSMAKTDHSHWAVFKRVGKACWYCGGLIEYVKDGKGARGSYFCGGCQI